MNSIILTLNHWAGPVLALAWPMLWQSSLLIGFAFALDLALRHRLRASVRYALWLVVLAKLALPPSLALPTGLGWWLRPAAAAPAAPRPAVVSVTYGPVLALGSQAPMAAPPRPARPAPRLSAAAWALGAAGTVSLGLLAWMLVRWGQVAREARRAAPAPGWLEELFAEARRLSGLRRGARLRLIDGPMSPAVCGLLRPVILVPRALAERLPPDQLRTVLLHELVHLRRGDVWLSLVQSLLQIIYWWHPLLWLANARIRRAREEAVDDAVVLALEGGAEAYAPTLLEVARLALARPPASLGLVGILESRSFLRQRIERLLEFRPPRRAGLTLVSLFSVAAFAALALPMGQAPAPAAAGPATPSQPQASVAASTAPAASTTISANKVSAEESRRAAHLLQDGKLLYEMGKLDEAEAKLKAAMRLDQGWKDAAYYYLKLISEARFHERLREEGGSTRTNLFYTGRGRQIIFDKLNHMGLDEIKGLNNAPLSEVIKVLESEALKCDPAGHGINFILAPASEPGALITNETQTDPYTGLPVAAPPTETADIGAVRVKLSQTFHDIRPIELLDEIVKAADRPIKYTVEDFGIVFSLKGREPVPLYFKVIKLDPNSFAEGLREVMGPPKNDQGGVTAVPRTNASLSLQHHVRAFLEGLGVDFTNPPGKSVFFNDREGCLLVYAAMSDLDIIERAVQVLSIAPPQVNIKAVFLQLPKAEAQSFWDEFGYTNLPASSGSVRTTTLTDSEAQALSRRWESKGDAHILGQAQVTTLDGRQVQVSVQDVRAMVTRDAQGQAKPGNVSLGPTLDVIPYVSADGFSVQMTLIPSLAEFIGYDDPGPFQPMPSDSGTNAAKVITPQPVPHFRVAQLAASVKVRDGQTAALGNFTLRDRNTLKEQIQGLADLAIVGPLVRDELTTTNNTEVLVFVTPLIVDPAGNPIHSPPTR